MKRIITLIILCCPLVIFAQNNKKDFDDNYKKGIELYNKGVDVINNVQPTDEVMRLDEIQESAKKYFKEALPFLEKACSLNSKDKNTLTALTGIYFSMNDFEKSDKYKKELEALKK